MHALWSPFSHDARDLFLFVILSFLNESSTSDEENPMPFLHPRLIASSPLYHHPPLLREYSSVIYTYLDYMNLVCS